MFIEVHKVSDLADAPLIPLAINVGDIMGISGAAVPRAFQNPPVGTRATIFLRGYDGTAGTDGLMIHVSEHFDELVTALPDVRDTRLPEVKRAEPAAGRICPEDCLAADCFLRTMRGGVSRECGRHGSCESCRHNEHSVVCWFRSLTDDEIRTIVVEYERLRNLKGQEAANG
jgi:hypothetical protein